MTSASVRTAVLYICINRTVGHREALLEGAIDCLQELGYARTTARAVVERSRTNLGSIAYHFGSIERLREEALLAASRRWLAPAVAAARATGPRPPLETALRAFVEGLEDHRELALAFCEALAQAGRHDRLRTRLAAAYDELREVITAAGRSYEQAALIIALFDGLMLQWLLDPRRVDDRFVNDLVPHLRALERG